MSAEVSADVERLFAGSDFKTTATLADGCDVVGVFLYGYAESLDYNGRLPKFTAASGDVSDTSVADVITIDAVEYTVRAIEQGDRVTVLFLEKP